MKSVDLKVLVANVHMRLVVVFADGQKVVERVGLRSETVFCGFRKFSCENSRPK